MHIERLVVDRPSRVQTGVDEHVVADPARAAHAAHGLLDELRHGGAQRPGDGLRRGEGRQLEGSPGPPAAVRRPLLDHLRGQPVLERSLQPGIVVAEQQHVVDRHPVAEIGVQAARRQAECLPGLLTAVDQVAEENAGRVRHARHAGIVREGGEKRVEQVGATVNVADRADQMVGVEGLGSRRPVASLDRHHAITKPQSGGQRKGRPTGSSHDKLTGWPAARWADPTPGAWSGSARSRGRGKSLSPASRTAERSLGTRAVRGRVHRHVGPGLTTRWGCWWAPPRGRPVAGRTQCRERRRRQAHGSPRGSCPGAATAGHDLVTDGCRR